MASNFIASRNVLTDSSDDSALLSFSFVARDIIAPDSVSVALVLSIRGAEFVARSLTLRPSDVDTGTVAGLIPMSGGFWSIQAGDCLNVARGRAPKSATLQRAADLMRADFNSRPGFWVDALAGVVNDALKLAGASPAPSPADAGLRAELERVTGERDAARNDAARAAADLAELRRLAADAKTPGGTPLPVVTPGADDTLRAEVARLSAELAARDAELARLRPAEPIRHDAFATVRAILEAGLPCWLWGEAGTGKSVIAEQVAEVCGWEYHLTGSILDEFAGLKGFIDANGAEHETEFTRALKSAAAGRDVLICLDECDGSIPEVLLALNNLLAGGGVECCGTLYRMSEHLHVVACGNTNGRGGTAAYNARAIIDAATLDRFAMVEVGYSERVELAVSGGDAELAAFARGMRESAAACGVELLVTYRAISRLAKLSGPLGRAGALQVGFVRGMGKTDLSSLLLAAEKKLSGNPWFETLSDIAATM